MIEKPQVISNSFEDASEKQRIPIFMKNGIDPLSFYTSEEPFFLSWGNE